MVLFSRVFNELQASRYSGLATCHDFPKYDYGHLFINRLHLGIAKQLVPALDTGTPLKPRHPFYSILILIARENSWEKWCGDHVHHVPSSQLETQHSPLHVSNAIRHEANPQNDHAFFGNTVKSSPLPYILSPLCNTGASLPQTKIMSYPVFAFLCSVLSYVRFFVIGHSPS